MTVARLRVEMPADEFLGWGVFDEYERRQRKEEEQARESAATANEPADDEDS